MDILNFIFENKEYLKDFVTRSTYHSNAKDDRVKYFELIRNNNIKELAEWFKELSNFEKDRINKFI